MISLKLNRRDEVPPGGFRYLVEETRTWVTGQHYDDWRNNIKKHYAVNNIPLPANIEDKMEEFLCRILPPGQCNHQPPSRTHRLTMNGIISGTKTLLGFFTGGRKKVSQEEADNRSDICSRCPYNQKPDGCHSCSLSELHNVVNSIVGAKKTRWSDHLNGCTLCSCSLEAKVWLELDLLQSNTSEDINNELPEWCWLKRK